MPISILSAILTAIAFISTDLLLRRFTGHHIPTGLHGILLIVGMWFVIYGCCMVTVSAASSSKKSGQE